MINVDPDISVSMSISLCLCLSFSLEYPNTQPKGDTVTGAPEKTNTSTRGVQGRANAHDIRERFELFRLTPGAVSRQVFGFTASEQSPLHTCMEFLASLSCMIF